MSSRTELEAFMNQLEELWSHQDTLFKIIGDEDLWDSPHGPDWTYADVPYHLTYCNRDLVARPIEMGREFPADQRLSFDSVAAINEWNDRKFAERPADQTPAESVAQLHASWDEIRRVTRGMSDDDLGRPYWTPFNGGMWQTAVAGLSFCRGHDWSEFMQLRIHMGRSEPVPSADITTSYLTTMVAFAFPPSLNQEAAQGQEFKAVMSFSDPGVSAVTIAVSDGAATVVPGHAEDAHVVLTMTAETFEKALRGIQPFADAMAAGAIKVDDFEGLATFGELFPM